MAVTAAAWNEFEHREPPARSLAYRAPLSWHTLTFLIHPDAVAA
jgi:hypothetical protein